jgi:hypothetical protein
MPATATEIEVAEPLAADNRCDRCRAQAHVVMFWPDGDGALDLAFCLHHWHEIRAAVLDVDGVVIHVHPLP